jgi:two-component system chemotaxis response regulator CheY
MMIKNALKDQQHEFKEAENFDQAVEAYPAFHPNLTFLDVVMPGKNGIETLRELRKIDPAAIIVMCTSIGGQEKIVSEAVEAGAADFVTKPFKPDDIRNIVQHFAMK